MKVRVTKQDYDRLESFGATGTFSRAQPRSLEDLDTELLAKKTAILKRIDERFSILLNLNIQTSKIKLDENNSEVTIDIQKAKDDLKAIVNNIHQQTFHYPPLTRESTRRRIKEEALEALIKIEQSIENSYNVISNELPSFFQGNIYVDLLLITVGILTVIAAILFIPVLVYIAPIIGPMLFALGTCVMSPIVIIGCGSLGVGLMAHGGNSIERTISNNKLSKSFTEIIPAFFHHQKNTLLSTPAVSRSSTDLPVDHHNAGPNWN